MVIVAHVVRILTTSADEDLTAPQLPVVHYATDVAAIKLHF